LINSRRVGAKSAFKFHRPACRRAFSKGRFMSSGKSKAFTLVELLVVIGIIALLISILLPSLSKAREYANTVKCSANLKSIGQGVAMYAANYHGAIPAAVVFSGMQLRNGQQYGPGGTQAA